MLTQALRPATAWMPVTARLARLSANERYQNPAKKRGSSHTYATTIRRGGVPVEIVSKLLCHRSVQTTSDIYLHASPQDLRAELERAGVLERLGALP
jgi:integrase